MHGHFQEVAVRSTRLCTAQHRTDEYPSVRSPEQEARSRKPWGRLCLLQGKALLGKDGTGARLCTGKALLGEGSPIGEGSNEWGRHECEVEWCMGPTFFPGRSAPSCHSPPYLQGALPGQEGAPGSLHPISQQGCPQCLGCLKESTSRIVYEPHL